MTNDLVTTMIITTEDSKTYEKTLQRPKWQEPERPPQNAEVVTKFMSIGTSVLWEGKAQQVVDFVLGGLSSPVSKLMDVLF